MTMFGFKPAALGAALMGTSAAIALGVAPAQAAVFNAGDALGLSGEAQIINRSGGGFTIQFYDPTLPKTLTDSETVSNDFDIVDAIGNFVLSTESSFGDIIEDIDVAANGTYKAAANPWVSVKATYIPTGTVGNLLLFLNDGEIDLRLVSGSTFEFDLTGTFSFAPPVGSDLAAFGEFSVNVVRNADDTFNIVATAVPEPLTMLGAGAAVAFGGAFKRKLNKKDKKGSTKA